MKDLIKTKFGLYEEGTPVYEGYYLPNNRWNGWLQPLVDKKTFKKIVKDVFPTEWNDSEDRGYWEDFKNQKPNKDGLYDVSWGICWMSEDD
tara:strand:+ start:678 stop:950 length:273 start_codon:yes stop_codon:yes gene_type:complete